MKRFCLVILPLALLCLITQLSARHSLAQQSAGDPGRIEIGEFSSGMPGGELPSEWEPLAFKNTPRHTRYELVNDNGIVAVKAESRSAASGLIRRVVIDPHEYPIVAWHWKIDGVLNKGDASRKSGDDYPARLYITFAYDAALLSIVERIKYLGAKLLYGEDPPAAALTYIWGNRVPKGSVIPNPYTGRAMMVVVESGDGRSGQWVSEERNLLADYRRAFNSEPPLISGVAIMTDTDNTGESATAYYGDIVFKKK